MDWQTLQPWTVEASNVQLELSFSELPADAVSVAHKLVNDGSRGR